MSENQSQQEKPAATTPTPTKSRFELANPAIDERQRAIIRQHSQSMAIEVLKLKNALNELVIADLAPTKLRQLADYFDKDVLGVTETTE